MTYTLTPEQIEAVAEYRKCEPTEEAVRAQIEVELTHYHGYLATFGGYDLDCVCSWAAKAQDAVDELIELRCM
jgi:hypothetical protein